MGTQGAVQTMDDWLDARLRNIHTMIPGKIESYSGHKTRKATVKPLVKFLTVDGQSLEIPPIANVPVIFPSSGKFSLLFPLKKGDGCKIEFSESGIGNFLNGKVEVDADSLARFQLTDAVCIPGLWSFKNVPDSDSSIEVDDNGNIKIKSPTGTTIELGDNPTKQLVNDYLICPFTGAPHVIANKQVKV
jgi:hypothetical protein